VLLYDDDDGDDDDFDDDNDDNELLLTLTVVMLAGICCVFSCEPTSCMASKSFIYVSCAYLFHYSEYHSLPLSLSLSLSVILCDTASVCLCLSASLFCNSSRWLSVNHSSRQKAAFECKKTA